ncbi:MAG: murein biosynthesis integral membrane protein MurJ [Ferrovibrio sp.]|uniref:murein biosynthesis integral membrane protein MurJ n=1 Tax=Ferrovibrio sp. TaxID=1917215 RepID=UPI0039192D85
MSLFRAIATVGGLTMVSRIAGFIRDLLIARYLGAGPVADAFFVSLRLPNFFRSLFAEGAFTAGFLPLFSHIQTKEGQAAAQLFAERALAVLLLATFGFTLIAQIAMPAVIILLAPGFVDDPQRFDLSVTLTVITFPYLLFVSLASLYGAVLNCLGRFFAMAATPILLNLVMIAGMLLLTPHVPNAGYALAWSVLVGGILQFLWLAWDARRNGIDLRLRRPRLNDKLRRLFKLILPAALGAGATQVNLMVGLILASLLPAGAVSYLFYADRINQLTIGVVGVAIATALLPTLSAQLARDDHAGALVTQNRALEFALLLALPSCTALLVVPFPIISILFQRGEFDLETARQTSAALFAYAVGLPGYVLARTCTPGFHARQDTRTPVKLALVSIVVNIGLSLALMPRFGHVGLALATALAASVNTMLLLYVLRRRGHWRADDRLKARSWRILVASLAMVAVLAALDRLVLPGWYAGGFGLRIAALVALVGSGLVTFLLSALVLGATRPAEWRTALRR